MTTYHHSEANYENTLIRLFQDLGYQYECGYDVERDYRNPYYEEDLRDALRRQNPMLSEVKGDIVARVKYPTNESSLNGANWKEAVSKLQDGTNNYYSKMYWDVRTSSYDHPANK